MADQKRSRDDGETMTGAEILWESLVREGVETVFGYPGGAILPAYDALGRFPIHHVLVRHEQGAAHMADGYARASGRVGVAIATSGPGATNLTTGIATAMLDSVPTVFITGQVPSKLIGSDAFQEVDVTGITLPITKHNELVTDVNRVAPAIREAFAIAKAGRPGPVLVDICKDTQQAKTRFQWPDEPQIRRGQAPPPRETDLKRAADLIAASARPLILAGHGVIRAGASRVLQELAERADLPVALTLLGLGGFPASHSLSLGMMGMHGEAYVNRAIQRADLIIALGMRFDDRVTGKLETFARHARKIHVELDASEINKNVAVDVAVHADVREALEALLPLVPPAKHTGLAGGDRRGPGRDALARPAGAAGRRPSLRGARHPRAVAGHEGRTRSSSPTSASTRCGRRSTTRTSGRARSSPRAAWARWASPCRPRSARSSRGPTPRCGWWRATAASR